MSRTLLHRQIKRFLLSAQSSSEEKSRVSPQNRRQLLQGAAALVLWQTLPACVTQEKPIGVQAALKSRKLSDPVTEELVIVGGGLAGLTAAYELSKANVKVSVYEGSLRMGGRAFTQENFNKEKMFCERGGELIDTGHEALHKITAELNLEMQPLQQDGDPPRLKDLFYFGGRYRSEAEIIKAFKPLAKVILRDQKHITRNGELFVPTYKDFADKNIRRLDLMSVQSYLDACKKNVDAWVLELVRIAFVGEYGTEADQQSALNLLVLIEGVTKDGFKIFGESDEAFRIKGGTSTLTNALVKALEERSVPIHRGQRLVAIKDNKSTLSLSFLGSKGDTQEVLASKSILAIPFSVLKDVEGIISLSLSARKHKAIQEWGFGTNAKVMIGYKSRYWRRISPGFQACEGSVLSDLALQQTWDSSRGQEGEAGILTCFFGGKAGENLSPSRLTTTRAEVNTLFPGIDEEFSGEKVLEVWTASPWVKGSFSSPRPGQYTELVGSCAESELEGRLLFAGEHCSVEYAGYLNGAIESGMVVSATLIAEESARLLQKKA